MDGASVATTLKTYAVPTPSRDQREHVQLPRSQRKSSRARRTARPPHTTTGVASAKQQVHQGRRQHVMQRTSASTSASISSSSGQCQQQPTPGSAATCRRARDSISSNATTRGSSAMPQIGHAPGCVRDDLRVHRTGPFGAGDRRRLRPARAPCRTSDRPRDPSDAPPGSIGQVYSAGCAVGRAGAGPGGTSLTGAGPVDFLRRICRGAEAWCATGTAAGRKISSRVVVELRVLHRRSRR